MSRMNSMNSMNSMNPMNPIDRAIPGVRAAESGDFSPPLLRIQERHAPPLAGWMLRLLIVLAVCVLA